jgi:hypothetical protein
MRTGTILCATAAVAFIVWGGALRGGPDKEAARVTRLIEQLGDDEFETREAATKALAKVGEPALPALRKASAASADLEVRRRAARLVEVIESNLGYLFNGKDLTGWHVGSGDPRQWKVEGGAIVARSVDYRTRNYLLSARDYTDFTLRFEFLIEPGSGGGVVLRALDGEKIVDENCDHPVLKLTDPATFRDYSSGTTHFVKDANQHCRPIRDLKLRAGAWHAAAITVRGDACVAVLAGKQVVDLRRDRNAREGLVPALGRSEGKIGLQAHTGTMRYRRLQIKELAPAPVKARPPR